MKITECGKKNVEFKTLDYGDVFRCENNLFIKTLFLNTKSDLTYNAVCLESGVHTCFDDGKLVELLDAELIIRG